MQNGQIPYREGAGLRTAVKSSTAAFALLAKHNVRSGCSECPLRAYSVEKHTVISVAAGI
jgi:hypothetical protein